MNVLEKTYAAAVDAYEWAKAKTTMVVAIGTAGAAVVAAPAHAAAIDVAAVVTDISAQAAPIALIGGAVLVVYVGIKAFRWVRGALS